MAAACFGSRADFNLIEIDPEILAPHSLDLVDLMTGIWMPLLVYGIPCVAAWYENSKGLFTKHMLIGIRVLMTPAPSTWIPMGT